ncbi:MAG: DNA polymerase III subunit alpha [Phycisphaerae bacterium]|nr:DNA polymerase III subunit alpha [Phycisphaerae bacterium]
MDGFVHLHVHSHYSLLDGAAKGGDLLSAAAEMGMKSLALTDHGNLFGAVDFYQSAGKAGVKPILGMEAYISPTTRDDRSMGNPTTACYHLLLLAMNNVGWRNLMRLSSRAYLEGFYYRPRVDRELLAEFHEGLVCTTACLGGEVPSALIAGDSAKAKRIAGEYLDIFGPKRFFIEVQNQGIDEQTRVNPLLVKLAGELGVGLVGTNDVHFLTADCKPSHEVLTCISTGKTLQSGGALEYPPTLYLRPAAEMRDVLKEFPGAADNTLKIAEMCDVKLDFSAKYLPVFPVPGGKTDDEYLAELAEEGLVRRFGAAVTDEQRQRLAHELETIKAKRYSSYVLIVNEFVQYARENSIPAAPRGSACATFLGYCLGIGNVDPMKYGLLFERWTDVQREEDPDFDIDICQEGRGRIIQYVREKYGHVAQIITYGTLKAKAVIRDVGRVLDVPLAEVDAICKLVPNELKMTLDKALSQEPELKKLHDADPKVKQMMEHGRRLEGLARHAGVHAAGVIVCDKPLEDIVPLCKQSDSDDAITQWDGPTCEKVGLMKMDFLGLRTLTILQRCRELVHQHTGKDIDPETVPLDDEKVFDLFRTARTDGVFQFESDGMKNVLVQMQPSRIEDLIAANAMFRPGPMELIPTYCSRKHGRESTPSVHPLVDDILAETYGIMCYQEQVMQVLNRLGKLPLNRALTLIKAISKKKEKEIARERPNFLNGAGENGIEEADAVNLFDLILKFAGYGFNKAHSTRYAIVAYQTAYFKAHHPREFLAATLTYECNDTDKVVQYMAEAERMGIKILPPEINACGADFAVDGQAVRFGLAAVKGVGHKAVESIVAARNEVERFRDLYHFCEYVDLRVVNKSAIEALIKCGAFDSLGAHRAAMSAAVEKAIQLGNDAAVNRKSGQMSFFGEGGFAPSAETQAPQFPKVAAWSETQLLAAEKETLGFYVTSRPLVRYGRELESLSAPPGASLANLERQADRYRQDTRVRVGCSIASVRPTFTRKDNRKMAMLTLEDLTGKCDAVVFPDTYETFADRLHADAMVFITGSVDRSRERANLRVDEVRPIDEALEAFTSEVHVELPAGATKELTGKIAETLKAHKGPCAVFVKVRPAHRADITAMVRAGAHLNVKPSRELIEALEKLLGDQKYIRLTPKPVAPPETKRWRSRTSQPPTRLVPRVQNAPASEAVTRFD